MTDWHVVNTLPHQKFRAEANLQRQGFHTWLPKIRTRRSHARKVEYVQAPLFSGYLFLSLDLQNQNWAAVNNTFGVKRLLCNRDKPAPPHPTFIDGLLKSMDSDGFIKVSEPELLVGQKIRLVEGAFAGHAGTHLRWRLTSTVKSYWISLSRDGQGQDFID